MLSAADVVRSKHKEEKAFIQTCRIIHKKRVCKVGIFKRYVENTCKSHKKLRKLHLRLKKRDGRIR